MSLMREQRCKTLVLWLFGGNSLTKQVNSLSFASSGVGWDLWNITLFV